MSDICALNSALGAWPAPRALTTLKGMTMEMKVDDLGGDYDPDLYRADAQATTAPLPAAAEWPQWESSYRERGFQAVRRLFDPQMVGEAMAGIDTLISGAVPQFRGIQWGRAAKRHADSSDLATRRDLFRKLMYYIDHDERLHRMAHAPQVIQLMERLLGGPVSVFADQALLKPPGIGREKPWHQD